MTTEQKQLAAIIATAIFLALLTCTWFSGYHKGQKSVKCPSVQTDTIVRIDTIVYDHPVEVEKWKEKTVYIAIKDTQIVHTTDSVYVVLEREKKAYSGEDYKAIVSGVQPSLDLIEVFPKTTIITNTIEKPTPYKWSLSAFGDVGYPLGVRAGLTFDKQVSGPLWWYVQGGYEYNPSHKGVFVQGGVRLDILKK